MNPSATLASLAARLDRLESKDAIRDIVTAYAIACDEHDMPRLMNLFTVDACFDAPNGSMVAEWKESGHPNHCSKRPLKFVARPIIGPTMPPVIMDADGP